MTDESLPLKDDSAQNRDPTEITPGVPKAENVAMFMLGVLCTLAVIVHVVLVFT